MIEIGYTMGVNQNQNVKNIPKKCPTSLKNTFRVANNKPSATPKKMSVMITGKTATNTMPGNPLVITKKPKNKPKITPKLMIAAPITMTAKHCFGN